MAKLTNEELCTLSNQVEASFPCEMIRQIMEWQQETKSETVYNTLDSVIDIIIDNTIWE